MADINEGAKVAIVFEAKLETGEVVLKTEENKPLEIVVGDGNIPKTIEQTLKEMDEGETKTVTLEPIEAFGPKIDDLILDLPREGFDTETELETGSKVSIDSPDGKQFTGIILEVKEKNVSVDFNHPLAGKSLIFTVTVVQIL